MKSKTNLRAGLMRYGEWYLLILIPVIGTIVFNIMPLLITIFTSTQNSLGNFIGTANYKILFSDAEFRDAMVNTLYMGVLGVGLSIPIAFMLAHMLNRIVALKNVYKTIFLLPMIVSIVAVAMIFKHIFNPDPASIANYVLSFFGIKPLEWFASTATARETVIIMTLWKNIGYSVILFFAGMQAIPVELYEAAEIDGANELHKLRSITIPCMRNTLVFVYITNSISALKRFADVYAVSSEYGYPANKLITIMLYIYRKSFSTLFYKDGGVAASASTILFVLILVITIFNWKITGEGNDLVKSSRKRRV